MAAALAGERQGKPPPELKFANRFRKWGDPYGGGWMEWPAGLIDKAETAENVFNAFRSYINSGGGANWARNNGASWHIVTLVKRMRGDYG